MKKFNYSFLEHGLLPSGVVNSVATINRLKVLGDSRKDSFKEIFTRLESIARVQSVKDSNEIEGIVTSDERINEIVNQYSAPLNHNEAEIAGYRDALDFIHQNYSELSINEETIFTLHKMIHSYSPAGGGEYKKSNNLIMEIKPDGIRRTRFVPVTAKETPFAMEQLILAYTEAEHNYNINQLLLIPCFVLDFLCIHPFSDGNGRLSRLLSLLMLYKNDFDAGKYISFEEQINNFKSEYYKSLQDSSKDWHNNTNSYFPFMGNFITTLLYCYKELDKRFLVVNNKRVNKKNRVEAVVLNSLLPISKREICYILPDVSPTTVEAALAAMLKNHTIKKIGTARSTKYIKQT